MPVKEALRGAVRDARSIRLNEVTTIKEDDLTTPEAVLKAFKDGKHSVTHNVAEFIKGAKYGKSKDFHVIIETPGTLGFDEKATPEEVIERATHRKYGFKRFTDQKALRVRTQFRESAGQRIFLATEPHFTKGKFRPSYLMLLEKDVIGGHSWLSQVNVEELNPNDMIMFCLD